MTGRLSRINTTRRKTQKLFREYAEKGICMICRKNLLAETSNRACRPCLDKMNDYQKMKRRMSK